MMGREGGAPPSSSSSVSWASLSMVVKGANLSITSFSPLSTSSCRGQARTKPSLAPSLILAHSLPSIINDNRDKTALAGFAPFFFEDEEEEEEVSERCFSASWRETAARWKR